jgi:MSHA biogenesis protein MshP
MHRQHGFSLVPAIFLIVVVAALAAFAVRIGMSRQENDNLVMLGDRALVAAKAGAEWATYRAHPPPPIVPTCTNRNFTLDNFAVQVVCTRTVHGPTTVYDISSTAQRSVFGSPDHALRQLHIVLTSPP